MTNTLSFPGLGITIELNRVAFSIGDFPIYWYGITFALAFLVGVAYFYRHSRQVGIHPDDGFDILLCAVVGGVIGARAYYVIFQWDAMYKDDPMKIFAFREGGLAIYGGVIGAILVGALVSWLKKVPLIPMLDVCLPALLMGQGIGRWGNFFNIEAFGSNTTLPWGMTSPVIEEYLSRPSVVEELAKLGQTVDPTLPVHPTFFYEFVWNTLGFLLLAYVLTPRRKYDGQVALGYMAWYGLGRFFIEQLRTDSLVTETPWGVIRVSQWLGMALFLLSAVLLIVFHFRAGKEDSPSWLRLYVNTEESALAMAKADRAAKGIKDVPEDTPEQRAEDEPEENGEQDSSVKDETDISEGGEQISQQEGEENAEEVSQSTQEEPKE
ncbi:prolipoprotein diacylglyceryl transferase [Angelakisella massiliensis]|uniref:prolipoprotein diacylglyceryl transferase n=1 Tax=Angelakisella massiliensis TaxID=1871018 RepID=UPI0008F840C3|nr:prolipoprotein diacylglyceryl transferase [Angelakisella massiliensis]